MDAQRIEDSTRALLDKRLAQGDSLAEIARHSELTASWLRHWYRGKIKNPGLYTIERLRSYLDSVT